MCVRVCVDGMEGADGVSFSGGDGFFRRPFLFHGPGGTGQGGLLDGGQGLGDGVGREALGVQLLLGDLSRGGGGSGM